MKNDDAKASLGSIDDPNTDIGISETKERLVRARWQSSATLAASVGEVNFTFGVCKHMLNWHQQSCRLNIVCMHGMLFALHKGKFYMVDPSDASGVAYRRSPKDADRVGVGIGPGQIFQAMAEMDSHSEGRWLQNKANCLWVPAKYCQEVERPKTARERRKEWVELAEKEKAAFEEYRQERSERARWVNAIASCSTSFLKLFIDLLVGVAVTWRAEYAHKKNYHG